MHKKTQILFSGIDRSSLRTIGGISNGQSIKSLICGVREIFPGQHLVASTGHQCAGSIIRENHHHDGESHLFRL